MWHDEHLWNVSTPKSTHFQSCFPLGNQRKIELRMFEAEHHVAIYYVEEIGYMIEEIYFVQIIHLCYICSLNPT
jgi:hypothetical protein